MRKALIKDGAVLNVILIEEDFEYPLGEGETLVDSDEASPGDTYDGKVFIRPEPEPPVLDKAAKVAAALEAADLPAEIKTVLSSIVAELV